MLFQAVLKRLIQKGTLTLITADERRYEFGAGDPKVTVRLHKKVSNGRLP